MRMFPSSVPLPPVPSSDSDGAPPPRASATPAAAAESPMAVATGEVVVRGWARKGDGREAEETGVGGDAWAQLLSSLDSCAHPTRLRADGRKPLSPPRRSPATRCALFEDDDDFFYI